MTQPARDIPLRSREVSDVVSMWSGSTSPATMSPRIAVVMPAYNAAKTLAATVGLIPRDYVHDLILVDDGSRDTTIDVARELGLNVVPHHHNAGYGANQKTCYQIALHLGADVVVMLHPDGQYDPALVPEIIEPILRGEADVVFASRMMAAGGAKAGGMPLYKRVANRFLTAVENLALGARLSEAHTGYRAYSRDFLETIPWRRNHDDFVFDTEVIFQSFAFDQRLVEIPVATRYEPESSSASFRQSLVYGTKTLVVALRYVLHRFGIKHSRLFRP